MKSDPGSSILRRAATTILCVMLIVGMMPLYSLPLFGKDDGRAYAAAIPADGKGWTASGQDGLKYFQAIYGNGNQITSWSWNTELSSGVYYVMNDITLQPDANNTRPRESALRIKAGADVKIVLLNNAKLTLTGGNAITYNGTYKSGGKDVTNTSTGGAGAGIYLPGGAKLTIDGWGKIVAKGGNAANGTNGEQGKTPWTRGYLFKGSGTYPAHSDAPSYKATGGGGYGGYGGGGAGAGIGTSGGSGGSRGGYGNGASSRGSKSTSGNTITWSSYGSNGGTGSAGGASGDSGTLVQYGNVTIEASGGSGGSSGTGAGGGSAYCTSPYYDSSNYRVVDANASGGGGGAGGGGLPANAIGSGGPGAGGGGGGGGSIAYGTTFGISECAAGGSGGSGGGGYSTNSYQRGTGGVAYNSPVTATGNTANNSGSYRSDYYYAGGSAPGYTLATKTLKPSIITSNKKVVINAYGGNGGAGGASGKYGKSGDIYTNKMSAANTNQRSKIGSYTCGTQGVAYFAYPERELVMTLQPSTASDRGPAELNPDGETWAYKGGTNNPVKPVINLKHVPTNTTLSNSTAFVEKYDNAGGAVTTTNSVQAIAKAESKGLTSNASTAVMTDSNYKDRDGNNNLYTITMNYTIDYPSYTVKIDAVGGTNSTTLTCKKGVAYPSVGTVVTPVREGYTFGGYYTQKNGEGEQYFGTDCSSTKATWDIGENTTLYAKWVPTKYKIKFFATTDPEIGSEYIPYEGTGSVTLEDGSKVMESTYGSLNLPTAHDLDITRPHYDFVGWNIYEDQDWAMYKADKTYRAGLTNHEGEIVNIYVAWRAKDMISVSYDANGGSAAPPVDGTWADADYKIPTQKPTRPGYAFIGWNTVAAPTAEEPGIEYQPEETIEAGSERAITKSITMYAQWERNHTVAYKTNGGMVTNGELVTEYPDTGSEVDVNYTAELTRTGYDFIGWRVSGTNTVYTENDPEQPTITVDGEELTLEKTEKFDMPDSNVVLYAQWAPQKMDVDYLADDLYALDGWHYGDKDGNVDWDEDTPPTGQKVEYDKTLKFSVVVDGSKVDDSAMRLRINGINIEPKHVTADLDSDMVTYIYEVEKVRGGQMISIAGLVGQTYPVILDAQDGDLVGNVTNHTFGTETDLPLQATDIKDEDGEVIKAADIPVKKGFKFEGWFEDSEGTGDAVEKISATAMPNSADGKSINLYAKWTEGKYSIQFVTGALPPDADTIYEEKYQDSVNDYNEDAAGFTDIGYSVKKNLPNLGIYVDYKYMEPASEGEQEVEKTATFMGWAYKKDAAEADFAPGMAIRRLSEEDGETIKLYPVWGAPHYTVILDGNGGKVLTSITGYQAKQEIDLPGADDVVREGYDFSGWYDTPNPTAGAQAVTKISRDDIGKKVYYADWTPKQYKYKLEGVDTATGQVKDLEIVVSGNKTVGVDTVTLSLPEQISIPEGKKLAGWTEGYTYDEEAGVAYPDEMIYMADEEVSDLWMDSEGKFTAVRELYPVWVDADSNTLTYDANGGEGDYPMIEAKATDPVTVFGEGISAPSRTGYKFLGFSEDKNWNEHSEKTLYTEGGDPATITLDKSKKLYAIWEVLSYDITFDANLGADAGKDDVGFAVTEGGQATYVDAVKQHVDSYEEEVSLAPDPEEPTRGDLYEFLGWSTSKNGAVVYQAGSKISGFADMKVENEQAILKGRTLYAVWMVKGATYLSFDANGGTGAPAMETYPKGTKNIDVSANASGRVKPTRHGYTFEGWQTLDATDTENPVYTDVTSINMPDTESGSITLYAKWKVEPGLNIVYQHDGSGSTPTDVKTYYKGEEAYVLYRPAPTKAGYTFDGWDVEGTDIQLRVGDEASEKIALDDAIFEAATPVGDSLVQIFLKAHFKANEYRVTFDANGGSGDVPDAIEKTFGTSVDMPGAPEGMKAPKGFTFIGWCESPEGTGTVYEAGAKDWDLSNANGDVVTLYAVYDSAATNVVFDNGDKETITKTLKYDEDLPEFEAVPEKTGYDFDGYYLEENGEKVKYYNSSMEALKKWDKTVEDLEDGKEAFEMKAEWKAQKYTVSYHDTNGVLVDSREVTYGESFRTADAADLTVPTGYRHIGWSLKNDPDQIVPDFEADKFVTPTKDNGLYNNGQTVTVYAVYQEIRKFNVNYDANGGTDAPQDNKKYEQGDPVTVSFNPVPKRANYDFLGWTTYSNTQSVLPGGAHEGEYYGDATIDGVESVDGKTYHYIGEEPSDSEREMVFPIKNDTKLYAVWVPKTYYTVEFFGNPNSNGGTGKVTGKAEKYTGPDDRSYTRSESNDGYKTDIAIFRSTSPYKGETSTKIKLPDGAEMFTNSDEDARFMGWAKNSDAKVADHVAGEELEDITMDENVVYSAVWAQPVREINLKDIEEPVYENAPSEDVEATDGSGVNVTKSTWSPSTDQFAAGTTYKLSVKMKAQDGFYFNTEDVEKKPVVKLNYKDAKGQVQTVTVKADDVTFNNEGNVLTAVYAFTTTENIVVNGPKDANKDKPVPVTGVTAPEAGKKLVTVGNVGDVRVDENSKYATIAWSAKNASTNEDVTVGTNAQPDTIYTATLRVKAAKGYEFKEGTTKVTFSGEEVDTVVDSDTGELVISYTFPPTAPVDNAINLKLSGSLRNGQSLPDQTFTSADNVDKGSRMATIDWFKVEKNGDLTKVDSEKAKVSPSTTYVAQVKLEPAKGYSFSTETTVTFAGTEMQVLAKDAAKPTGENANRWAQLQEDGSILVSHDFASSADVLQEIVAPGSVNAEYGTTVSAVEDLPREVQIITENGKANVDVTWVYENGKVIVINGDTEEESTDDNALNSDRKAHTVKLQGKVAIPEGVTIPVDMTDKTTITVKVAADPRLVPEANAVALANEAQAVIDRTPEDADPATQALKKKLEDALDEMDEYIKTWDDETDPSTVEGINDEMDKVRAAMYDLMNALEPIPVLPVKKLGEIAIGEKLPTQALSTDARVHDDSKPADISWTNAPKDTRVEEGKTYEAHIIFKPAYDGAFREGGLVMFDDNAQVEIHGAENTDGNRAWIDSEGNLHLIRTITVDKINLDSIDECAALNAEFGDSVESVGLPKTVTAITDAGERKLAVNWTTAGINLGDNDNREAHDVVVSGKAVKPDAIENPDEVSLDVEITIHVAADPRLVPEKKAADLKDEAATAIKDAQDAGIADDEIAALRNALEDMNNYIDKYNDPENPSTVDGINEKVKAAQDALDALKSFIEHNTLIQMTLFGTDEDNGHKLDYGEKFKSTYNLVTATDKDNSIKNTAVKTKWKTEDESVRSATDYLVEVTLQASERSRFNVNRKIDFDGVEILIKAEDPAENATEYAKLSEDKKSVVVARTYRSLDAEFKDADDIEDRSVAFGTEPTVDKLGLPEKVGITTDDKNKDYKAEIEWDLSAYDTDYNNRGNADADRTAHEVTVNGKLKTVAGVPDAKDKLVSAKIIVAADPRLETEASAKAQADDAQKLINEASDLGVGETESQALKNAVDAMNNKAENVDKDNPDRVKALQDLIDAAKDAADTLKKIVDDKSAANAVTEKVNALPAPSDIKPEDKEAIEAARKAYDALTEDQKAVAGDDVRNKLENAETALAKAIDDKKAADDEAARKEEARKAEEAQKAAEEAKANTVNESVGIREGSNLSAVDKFLTSRQSDSDPKGSTVAPLRLSSGKQTTKTVTLNYKKVRGASKYVIYGNECGKTKKLKKLKTTKKNKIVIRKISKKLRKGRYHKFIVVAVDENNKVISTSKFIHVATKGGKAGNYRTVRTQAAKKKNKVTLETGKTFELKAKAIPQSAKLTVKKHRGILYESSNTGVAKVTKKGVIRAVGTGTCKIYAYAQDGRYRSTIVTVK